MYLRVLVFKPDGQERARERGAREVRGNFLTLEMTERLINLIYDLVPHNVSKPAQVQPVTSALNWVSSEPRLDRQRLPFPYGDHFASLGRCSQ